MPLRQVPELFVRQLQLITQLRAQLLHLPREVMELMELFRLGLRIQQIPLSEQVPQVQALASH